MEYIYEPLTLVGSETIFKISLLGFIEFVTYYLVGESCCMISCFGEKSYIICCFTDVTFYWVSWIEENSYTLLVTWFAKFLVGIYSLTY